MRFMKASALFAFLVAACGGSGASATGGSGANATGGSGASGTGGSGGSAAGGGGSVGDMDTTVLQNLCVPMDHGTVQVLGTSLQTAIPSDGRVQLNSVPLPAVVEVSATGYGKTLSAERSDLNAEPLLALPDALVKLLYSRAGITRNSTLGTIGLAFVTGNNIPVGNVVPTLTAIGNGASTDKVPSYFLNMVQVGSIVLPLLSSSAGRTYDSTGVVLFPNVPPGTYEVHATNPGYDFPVTRVRVEAGTLTADLVQGTGSGSTAPVLFQGTVTAQPLFPKLPVTTPPALVGATVTLTHGPKDAVLSTSTDSNGHYQFELHTVGIERGHITIAVKSYPRILSARKCIGPTWMNTQNIILSDDVTANAQLLPALGGHPIDSTKGELLLSTLKDSMSGEVRVQGGTVSLKGSGVDPYYGRDSSTATCQAAANCSGGCPTGSRCENNECVLGTSPMCSLCGTGSTCPSGTEAVTLSGSGDCRCLTTQTDCSAANAACPAGTFCNMQISVQNGQRTITSQRCEPLGTLAQTADGGYAIFGNVPPGDYWVTGNDPAGSFTPALVRIEPGSSTLLNLRISAVQ